MGVCIFFLLIVLLPLFLNGTSYMTNIPESRLCDVFRLLFYLSPHDTLVVRLIDLHRVSLLVVQYFNDNRRYADCTCASLKIPNKCKIFISLFTLSAPT